MAQFRAIPATNGHPVTMENHMSARTNKKLSTSTNASPEGTKVKLPTEQVGSNVVKLPVKPWTMDQLQEKITLIKTGSQTSFEIVRGLASGIVSGKVLYAVLADEAKLDNVGGPSQCRVWNNIRQAHDWLKKRSARKNDDGSFMFNDEDAQQWRKPECLGMSVAHETVVIGPQKAVGAASPEARAKAAEKAKKDSAKKLEEAAKLLETAGVKVVRGKGKDAKLTASPLAATGFEQALAIIASNIKAADLTKGRIMAEQTMKMLDACGFPVIHKG